jgi:hypothetical protein
MDSLFAQKKLPVDKAAEFIEKAVGGSAASGNFHGKLPEIVEAGRLQDFIRFVDRFDKEAMDNVKEEGDLDLYANIIGEARDAINTRLELENNPSVPTELRAIESEQNTFNATGRFTQRTKKNRQKSA